MTVENAINIYTDGSSLSHPRRGGIGIRLVVSNSLGQEEIRDVSLPGYRGATSNQMELQACIMGIQQAMLYPAFNRFSRIVIHADSQYVVNNHYKAFYQWSKQRWCYDNGRPVANADLWKKLLQIIKKSGKYVDFRWVQGHAKNQHNKAADKIDTHAQARGSLHFKLRLS